MRSMSDTTATEETATEKDESLIRSEKDAVREETSPSEKEKEVTEKEAETTGYAISVVNLARTYMNVRAVNGITFNVPHGSVCGFVGANGAGKTTTMRILSTLDYATSGKAEICGLNVVHFPHEVRKLIGWMPDHFGKYQHLTCEEYLDFFARAVGLKGEEREQRVEDVMDFVGLTPLRSRLSNKLSKGQTQRLGLGRALLHDPQVLIMDEPAAGLDPQARVELKHLIRVLSEEGKTILISSHILSELAEMCDTLLFINGGKLVYHGDAETLIEGSTETSSVEYKVELLENPEKLEEWASLNQGVDFIEKTKKGGRIRVLSSDPAERVATLAAMVRDGLPVIDFHREERKLEDAFIDVLGNIDNPEGGNLPPPPPNQPPPITPPKNDSPY